MVQNTTKSPIKHGTKPFPASSTPLSSRCSFSQNKKTVRRQPGPPYAAKPTRESRSKGRRRRETRLLPWQIRTAMEWAMQAPPALHWSARFLASVLANQPGWEGEPARTR